MNKFVEIAITETANKLGIERKLVHAVVYHYFSGIYLAVLRGVDKITLMNFFSIKKNSKYELFRSKLKDGTLGGSRDSGNQGI